MTVVMIGVNPHRASRTAVAVGADEHQARQKLAASVQATGTLTEVFGVGPVIAATVIGEAGDISRFVGRDAFASYDI